MFHIFKENKKVRFFITKCTFMNFDESLSIKLIHVLFFKKVSSFLWFLKKQNTTFSHNKVKSLKHGQ